MILSTDRATYSEVLKLIRERMLESKVQLDSDNPEMLVRFNVQIYPVTELTT